MGFHNNGSWEGQTVARTPRLNNQPTRQPNNLTTKDPPISQRPRHHHYYHYHYRHPFLPACLRLGVLLLVSVLACSCCCLPASVSAHMLPVPPPALLACLPPALLACLFPSCPRCLFGPLPIYPASPVDLTRHPASATGSPFTLTALPHRRRAPPRSCPAWLRLALASGA